MTSTARSLDIHITRWVLEFLLRQPSVSEHVAAQIISNIHIPIPHDNPRFKKTLILRSIDSDISNGTISESLLESLETIKELDRRSNITTPDSMKAAYCAVAVECTVKYLGGLGHRRGEGKFFEAVKRIWRGRVGNLEEVKRSDLVTDELRKCWDEMEAAVWDNEVGKRLVERNTRNDALRLVGVYLGEAMGMIGPSFLEFVARSEREGKEKGKGNEDSLVVEMNVDGGVVNENDFRGREGTSRSGNESLELVAADSHAKREREIGKKTALQKQKHVAAHRRRRGPVRISDLEPEIDITSSKYNTLPSPEVNKVQEALKSSSMELQEAVKDPLPDALQLAGTLVSEIAKKILNKESSVENQNGKSVDASNLSDAVVSEMARTIMNREPVVENHNRKVVDVSTPANATISEMTEKIVNHESSSENQKGKDADGIPSVKAAISELAGKIMNCEPSLENRKGKGDDAPNPSTSHPVEPVQTKEGNAGIPSCSHQNNGASKPSLMERNSTARTFEWDDSIDGSPGGPSCMNRFRLDSPKRKAVSPLKEYKITKVARRRKMKRWSLEEEDALREGVQKFGRGNWKLILNSKRNVFAERTEVDLKDKWRNMTRY